MASRNESSWRQVQLLAPSWVQALLLIRSREIRLYLKSDDHLSCAGTVSMNEPACADVFRWTTKWVICLFQEVDWLDVSIIKDTRTGRHARIPKVRILPVLYDSRLLALLVTLPDSIMEH